MDNHEQGLNLDCTYCQIVFKDKNIQNCQYCNNQKHFFKPARMMDRNTSQYEIINYLTEIMKNFNFFENQTLGVEDEKKLIGLLEMVSIYNFDIKDFLINYIREFTISKT